MSVTLQQLALYITLSGTDGEHTKYEDLHIENDNSDYDDDD